ncbi:MAG: type II toxin-antitoxin system PemK/MazF family toxin [Bifidobacteriaceae bacterium]|jgi:mRNA interferase MazF|nr:type II toxin-antitoxin system PemK/MazF family toxin [Bifidobacteriaceae bacterium]
MYLFSRGQVYWADIGTGRKPYLVVSNNARHRQLGTALVVRVATMRKPDLDTMVTLGPSEPLAGSVLCDDTTVLYADDQVEPVGALSPETMLRVNAALGVALPI